MHNSQVPFATFRQSGAKRRRLSPSNHTSASSSKTPHSITVRDVTSGPPLLDAQSPRSTFIPDHPSNPSPSYSRAVHYPDGKPRSLFHVALPSIRSLLEPSDLVRPHIPRNGDTSYSMIVPAQSQAAAVDRASESSSYRHHDRRPVAKPVSLLPSNAQGTAELAAPSPLNSKDAVFYYPTTVNVHPTSMDGVIATRYSAVLRPQSATAADLPQELLDMILQHVCTDALSNNYRGGVVVGQWRKLASALRSCSLVCFHWAIKCRQTLYGGRAIYIRSLKDAQFFRRTGTHGSKRLVPISELIADLLLMQKYESGSSWIHHLNLPQIRGKLASLILRGPVPVKVPSTLLSSPHWSLPISLPIRRSLIPFYDVSLQDIHFDSFRDLAMLLFNLDAKVLELARITWKADATNTFGRQNWPCHRRRSLQRIEAKDCTDTLHVGFHSLKLHPHFSMVPDVDQVLVSNMLRVAECFTGTLNLSIRLPHSLEMSRGEVEVHFTFEPAVTSAVHPEPWCPLKGVLLSLFSTSWRKKGINAAGVGEIDILFDSKGEEILTSMLQSTTISAFVIAFSSFDALQDTIQIHEVLQTQTFDQLTYRFACGRTEDHPFTEIDGGRWIGIDPATMEPTGESWTGYDKIVPALLDTY